MPVRRRCSVEGCKQYGAGKPRCPAHTQQTMRRKNSRRSYTLRTEARKKLNTMRLARCYLCDIILPASLLELDHVVALVDGGTDTMNNLAPACRACHFEKTQLENQKRRTGY